MSHIEKELEEFSNRLRSYKFKVIKEIDVSSEQIIEYRDMIPPADLSYGTSEEIEVYPATDAETRFFNDLSESIREFRNKQVKKSG